MKNLFKKKGNSNGTTQHQAKSKLSLPKVGLFSKKDNQPPTPQAPQQPMHNMHNPEFTQQHFQQNNYPNNQNHFQQQPPTSAYASMPNMPLPNNNNKKNQMLLIALVIIVAILIIAVAAFFLLDDDKPETLDTGEVSVETVETVQEPAPEGSLENLAEITAGTPETEIQITENTTDNTVEPTTEQIQEQAVVNDNVPAPSVDNSATETSNTESINSTNNTNNIENTPAQPLDETEAQIAAAFSGKPLNSDKQKIDESSIDDLAAPILIEKGQ